MRQLEKKGTHMQTKGLWTVAALAGYAIVIVVSRQFSEFSGDNSLLAPWVYSGGYTLFGVLLLGAVARWWQLGSPQLWRPLMLSLGGLAAAVEIWLRPNGGFAATPLDRWMWALLSLLVVALLARLMPTGMIRRWLGVDRRLPNT